VEITGQKLDLGPSVQAVRTASRLARAHLAERPEAEAMSVYEERPAKRRS